MLGTMSSFWVRVRVKVKEAVGDLPRLDAPVRQVLRSKLEGHVRRLRQPMRAHLDCIGLQAGVDRVAGWSR